MVISPTVERPVIASRPTEPMVLRGRERERLDRRIQWETVFFGLLAAVGLSALLVAMLLGGLVAAGVTDFRDNAATFFDHLTTAGGGVAIAITALSYLTGGYVAARMARFDGWRQGLGIWMLSLLIAAAVVIAAWIAGGNLDPTKSISLPSNPVDTGPLNQSGRAILAVVLVVSLVAAVAGGILGERYHRAVDDDEDQPYGPDRVRQDALASAASSSEESTVSPAASP
jgi:Kef-type K+ transport system membrane component KefB